MKSASTLKKLVEESREITILYVEDDNDLRENTIRLLSAFFKSIDSAANGEEGLVKYKTRPYDVVISDLRMPLMDGIEMVAQIKKINDEQLVIITSAHDESQYLLKLIGMGVENFILKPLDIDQFLSVLIKTIKIINLKRMETDYKLELEKTVKVRTEELSKANRKLEGYNVTLEQKVDLRTAELNQSLMEVERANKRVMDSIEYAKVIQGSMLPNIHEIKSQLPDSFFLWLPRDIVGGDIYYTTFFDEGYIVGIVDCTGHGVPGALMTMLASSGLKMIVDHNGHTTPAKILRGLNTMIKTSLQQDTEFARSNDGLDAAFCYVEPSKNTLTFAGSRIQLVCIDEKKTIVIKGDKESIGYKNSSLDYMFTNHTIELKQGMCFYLFTDGFIDQVGGQKQFPLGRKKFIKLLEQIHLEPFSKQKELLLEAFYDYRGKSETRDDVTVVGFKIK